jgi:uncharacterized membrane protein
VPSVERDEPTITATSSAAGSSRPRRWRTAFRLSRLPPSYAAACAVAVTLLALPVAWFLLPREACWLVSFDAGASAYLYLAGVIVATADAARTRRLARRAAPPPVAAFWIVLVISCASALAAATMMHGAHPGSLLSEGWHFALAVTTIALAWTVLHADFGFRYASSYYRADPRAGAPMRFRAHSPPDFLDFMLLSFLIGVTTGASDVEIASTELRRMTLLHNLIAFLFNLVILSISINTISGALHV